MNVVKRVLSGIVAGGIVFAVLYLGTRFRVQWIVGFLMLGVAYPAAVEYLQLMRRLQVPLAAPEFLIWIPVVVFSYVFFDGRYGDAALLFAIAYQVLRYLGSLPHRTGFLQAVAGVFGLLYIPWLLHFFYFIYHSGAVDQPRLGATHALVVLLMVIGYDSGAYFVGSLFGRHRAFPTVSPNKTWEGIAGGFVFAVLGALLGASFSPVWRGFAFWEGFPHILASSFLVGWAVQLGDVFESKLKRAAEVKDSGTFLPGHGGALDRIDGLLFALPVFFYYYHYVLGFL
ncbi:MAG: phosphatidate cytidylyltransferase [Candidatus Bipolaricaulota bacterium]|jgi:phosphatidate cytidylyltransferase|nr:phosphatidate cytidylyltransferase [Candidatus Bipolaricaulota bacterium]